MASYDAASVIHRALQHGLCSLDEFISACQSGGLTLVADELVTVKDSLRNNRMSMMISAGLKTTTDSNAMLDTMLFRYDDLLGKVRSMQQADRRVQVGAPSGEGGASQKGPDNAAPAGGLFRTSTRPTLCLLLLLRASVRTFT